MGFLGDSGGVFSKIQIFSQNSRRRLADTSVPQVYRQGTSFHSVGPPYDNFFVIRASAQYTVSADSEFLLFCVDKRASRQIFNKFAENLTQGMFLNMDIEAICSKNKSVGCINMNSGGCDIYG